MIIQCLRFGLYYYVAISVIQEFWVLRNFSIELHCLIEDVVDFCAAFIDDLL